MITPAQMAATHTAAFSQSRPWSEAEFGELLQHPSCFAVGNAACFALVRVILDQSELLTIATHPDFRRQGLARSCMTQWQLMARDKGATTAFLEVAADNLAAKALYRACGFETCGARPGYYRREKHQPVDALIMRQSLT